MIEPVSLVATIGTIAATGFKVARDISDIVDELGTAGAQVKAVGIDTRAVALILHELKKRLDKAQHTITTEVADVAREIAALCKTDIDDIKQCLSPLMVQGGEDLDLKRKAKWLFAKSKIATKRASLDSLKLTLNLYLHTLDFMESNTVE